MTRDERIIRSAQAKSLRAFARGMVAEANRLAPDRPFILLECDVATFAEFTKISQYVASENTKVTELEKSNADQAAQIAALTAQNADLAKNQLTPEDKQILDGVTGLAAEIPDPAPVPAPDPVPAAAQ